MATRTTKRTAKTKPPKAGGKKSFKSKGTTAKRKVLTVKPARENSSIVKRRRKLQHSIAQNPPERLAEVEDKIKEVLTTSSKTERKSLAGIWAGKGFEDIDIEKALKEARDAMLQGTLNKNYE